MSFQSISSTENKQFATSNPTSSVSASPSPSPALSASSYTSTRSDDSSDCDINSLSLDDWGYPTRPNELTPSRSTEPKINTSVSQGGLSSANAIRGDSFGGTLTPVARRSSSAFTQDKSKVDVDGYTKKTVGEREEEEREEFEEEEDEEEVEPSGFDLEDEDEEDMHAYGVPAARGWRLKANKAKTSAFRDQVLTMFSTILKLETWSEEDVDPSLLPLSPDNLELKRISGAFSNAVFFVSYKLPSKKSANGPRTVLLRVYGSGTEVLLSRRAELLILHTLSSLYEIGPHILGTFANGRVETFFDAEPIGKEGMRDLGDRRETIREDGSLWVRGREGTAQWVARRMRQLHEVPLETMRAVLEQGDLRAGSENSSGLFGRGIENHLFARSHRPLPSKNSRGTSGQVGSYFEGKSVLSNQNPRESPAPMTPSDGSAVPDTSITASGVDYSVKQRNNSVTSFDSLATSYNSQDGGSMMSGSSENLLSSPNLGPSNYSDSILASRKGHIQSPYTFNTPSAAKPRRGSSTSRGNSGTSRQPYPGVWRRTKRWAREAGKVFALVDEFSQTEQGKVACETALRGTNLEGIPFSPFLAEPPPKTKSLELGLTLMNLQKTLLAIASIDFPRFLREMDAYKKHVRRWERMNGTSKRVLAHGDTQYSNLLLIKDGEGEDVGIGMPRMTREQSSEKVAMGSTNNIRDRSGTVTSSRRMPSRQRSRTKLAPYERLIVIDFEYCSPNPRAYDIANAFHEWRFDYHSPTDSWSPYLLPYPTREERRRWMRAYVEQGRLLRMRGKTSQSTMDLPGSTVPPPTEELILPPSILPASSLAVSQKAGENAKAKPVDQSSSPSHILGGRNKSFTVASTAILAGDSPTLNPISSPLLTGKSSLIALEASMEREIDRLEKEVEIYSMACHASWALWGVTFAKEQIELVLEDVLNRSGASDETILLMDTDQTTPASVAGCSEDFDNLRYTLGRVELFREEIAALGISV
ncbi:hypothetical protein CBS101457_006477 [Exobasidium rhododendri]|nr:hypothetical protein CBS101457_006477 [Exobasidium rhododendri]